MTTLFASEVRSTRTIIIHNIRIHFHARKSSWYMATLTFLGGVALTLNPTMLTGSVNAMVYFTHMEALAPQWVWRALFFIAGTSRLFALTINGSFPGIWWMPWVRLGMSALSAVLWTEVAMSVVSGPAAFGSFVYPSFVIVELLNVRQAIREAWGTYGWVEH